jgi:hypothetical protein
VRNPLAFQLDMAQTFLAFKPRKWWCPGGLPPVVPVAVATPDTAAAADDVANVALPFPTFPVAVDVTPAAVLVAEVAVAFPTLAVLVAEVAVLAPASPGLMEPLKIACSKRLGRVHNGSIDLRQLDS